MFVVFHFQAKTLQSIHVTILVERSALTSITHATVQPHGRVRIVRQMWMSVPLVCVQSGKYVTTILDLMIATVPSMTSFANCP